jgi:carbon-monoxide dehydrogenase medium subunit
MKAFEFIAARDARHAVALLAEHGRSARVIAGGTDLLADLKLAPETPRVMVDISRVPDLKSIEVRDDGLAIGALVTHTEILRSPVIQELFPALVAAAHTIGAVQTRNLGTLGGNLVTAVPSLDSGPALIALEAQVTMLGPAGERRLPLVDFFTGPRRTVLKPEELLTEIVIPKKNLGKPTSFHKFGLRKGQALALVNVAAATWLRADAPVFAEPRIALGAVAPKVICARQAEAYLDGRAATPEAMAEAGRIAAGEAKPISDFRASAGYRRDLITVLVRRALEDACAQARRPCKEGRP